MTTTLLKFLFLPLIIFIMGWKIGTIQGASAQIELNEATKSNEILIDLKLLRKKDYESLVTIKENSLDMALITHEQYEKSSAYFILYPFSEFYSSFLFSGLESAIEYRNDFPEKEYRNTTLENHEAFNALYEQVDNYLKIKQKEI